MNILHYTLGLPPQRSGGLTKYATDLMLAQSSEHNVSLLYPGRLLFFNKKRAIKAGLCYQSINVYELCNPSLIPLLYGISDPDDITEDKRELPLSVMESFYASVKPNVFHIHTWMGMPKELVFYLKEKGVKIVYTTHDYFGLCPKVNFINEKELPCSGMNNNACSVCNANAPHSSILRLRNSHILLSLKNNILLRRILKK